MNIINIIVSDDTLSKLKNDYKLSVTPTNEERISFYDTFDFRLYKNSISLYKREFNLYKKMLNSTESISIDISSMPIFLSDLPECEFKNSLVDITKPRKVLNIFDLDIEFKILENADIYLNLKSYYAIKDKKRIFIAHKIMGRYTKENKPLLKKLAKERIDTDIVSISIERLYKNTLREDIKNLGIEDDAHCSFKNIFKDLLLTIKENELGVKEGIDIEFLHDFRVAMRKTRSMLKFSKGMFDERFDRSFSHIARGSNTLRDLDVQIDDLLEYQHSLPPILQKDIRVVIKYLRELREREHKSFMELLDSEFYKSTIKDWQEALNKKSSSKLKTRKFVTESLMDLYSKIINTEITVDTKAKEMHSLRIKFKKFRYLFEFFIDIFKSDQKKDFLRALKDVQKNLGNFQDLQIQQVRAKELSIALFKESEKSINSIMILGKIATDLAIEQESYREEFFSLYQNFLSFDIETILNS
jgi:CHAD domain-containing protein